MAAAVTFTSTSPYPGLGTGTRSSLAPFSGACLTRAFIVSTKATTPQNRFNAQLHWLCNEYDRTKANSCHVSLFFGPGGVNTTPQPQGSLLPRCSNYLFSLSPAATIF